MTHNARSESYSHIHCRLCGIPVRVRRWGIAKAIGFSCESCVEARHNAELREEMEAAK